METIDIKKIGVESTNLLQLIGKQTFIETFAELNTEENMVKYLDESFNLDKLKTELTNQYSEFYLALFDSRPIGYLKVNFGQAQTDIKDDKALEIERIYVLREFYGKNIGQTLLEKALQIARQSKMDYVWLGVWEHNTRAISFYTKNGFAAFSKHIFRLGEDEQTDILMKRYMVAN